MDGWRRLDLLQVSSSLLFVFVLWLTTSFVTFFCLYLACRFSELYLIRVYFFFFFTHSYK